MKINKLIYLLACVILLVGCSSKKKEVVVFDFSEPTQIAKEVNLQGYTGRHADIVSFTQNGSTVVVKAKCRDNLSNDAIIRGNYYEVWELIDEHGFDTADEIQYWATFQDQKVVSFTVDKDTISKVKEGKILQGNMGDYVSDLWILPAMQN